MIDYSLLSLKNQQQSEDFSSGIDDSLDELFLDVKLSFDV
jgi:hypothetical protein